MVIAYAHLIINDDILNIFNEVIHSNESGQWKLAMEEKMKSLIKTRLGNLWSYLREKGLLAINRSTLRSEVL